MLDTLSLMQGHDAITGTHKLAVTTDYRRMMSNALNENMKYNVSDRVKT